MNNEIPILDTQTTAVGPTLADVLQRLDDAAGLSDSRRRDLKSAVSFVTTIWGAPANQIPLDVPAIAEKLDGVDPVARGMSAKRLANIRWGVMSALHQSGLKPGVLGGRNNKVLSPAWTAVFAMPLTRRQSIGLSRLAHYCGRESIDPTAVDDDVMAALITEVRETSLRRQLHKLHRETAKIWNELAAGFPDLGLHSCVGASGQVAEDPGPAGRPARNLARGHTTMLLPGSAAPTCSRPAAGSGRCRPEASRHSATTSMPPSTRWSRAAPMELR